MDRDDASGGGGNGQNLCVGDGSCGTSATWRRPNTTRRLTWRRPTLAPDDTGISLATHPTPELASSPLRMEVLQQMQVNDSPAKAGGSTTTTTLVTRSRNVQQPIWQQPYALQANPHSSIKYPYQIHLSNIP